MSKCRRRSSIAFPFQAKSERGNFVRFIEESGANALLIEAITALFELPEKPDSPIDWLRLYFRKHAPDRKDELVKVQTTLKEEIIMQESTLTYLRMEEYRKIQKLKEMQHKVKTMTITLPKHNTKEEIRRYEDRPVDRLWRVEPNPFFRTNCSADQIFRLFEEEEDKKAAATAEADIEAGMGGREEDPDAQLSEAEDTLEDSDSDSNKEIKKWEAERYAQKLSVPEEAAENQEDEGNTKITGVEKNKNRKSKRSSSKTKNVRNLANEETEGERMGSGELEKEKAESNVSGKKHSPIIKHSSHHGELLNSLKSVEGIDIMSVDTEDELSVPHSRKHKSNPGKSEYEEIVVVELEKFHTMGSGGRENENSASSSGKSPFTDINRYIKKNIYTYKGPGEEDMHNIPDGFWKSGFNLPTDGIDEEADESDEFESNDQDIYKDSLGKWRKRNFQSEIIGETAWQPDKATYLVPGLDVNEQEIMFSQIQSQTETDMNLDHIVSQLSVNFPDSSRGEKFININATLTHTQTEYT